MKTITRRGLLALGAGGALCRAETPLAVPVHVVLDNKAAFVREDLVRFWATIWPEAVQTLGRAGIQIVQTNHPGEVQRPPYREPVITGLGRGVLNLVLTSQVPVYWDGGRALSGVTTLYRGFHLCLVALAHAHGNRIPLLDVNTCLHEMLHALMGDIWERRPQGAWGQAREFRIDAAATRLWLFGGGAGVKEAARVYVSRLEARQP